MTENEFIALLASNELSKAKNFLGDDCALLEASQLGSTALISTDSMVEGVHFLSDSVDYKLLGRKIVAVSLSDIASMGGTPKFLSLNCNFPAELADQHIADIAKGVFEICTEYEVSLVGGDTVSSGELALASTIIGAAKSRAIKRHQAKANEDIWISGETGWAALGLAIRKASSQTAPRPKATQPSADKNKEVEMPLREAEIESALDAFDNPEPQIELGQLLAEENLASSMIDISDGLLVDLKKLLGGELSAVLETGLIPCPANNPKFLPLALGGGEDYELLFTSGSFNRKTLTELGCIKIGKVVEGPNFKFSHEGKTLSLSQLEEALGAKISQGFEHSF